MEIPTGLRRWFVVHFVVDMAFALPLFVAPTAMLGALGWQVVDPLATRLIAAALFGIGIESWIGRNADAAAFVAMLNLKIIWSASAALGIAWSLLEGAAPMAWALLATFVGFNGVWLYYRLQLGR